MIARDNHTRQQLNHAARERLKSEEILPRFGVRGAGREYAPGDQIIARRNDRPADVDNGMLGTVVAIDTRAHRMLIETETETGERRELDLAYVAGHVEHAYALTGHSAQGSTVSWAGVIGRPQEFSRERAYTALSRAGKHTKVHLIAAPSADVADRASYAPQQPEAARRPSSL
jgi:ATP-dependent exoDNAse (exonuclease V) alpha subunit